MHLDAERIIAIVLFANGFVFLQVPVSSTSGSVQSHMCKGALSRNGIVGGRTWAGPPSLCALVRHYRSQGTTIAHLSVGGSLVGRPLVWAGREGLVEVGWAIMSPSVRCPFQRILVTYHTPSLWALVSSIPP